MSDGPDRAKKVSPGRWMVYATLLFGLCFYGIPLVWLFLASFRTEGQLFTDGPWSWGSFAAFADTWVNLVTYNDFQMGLWAWNSLVYSVGGVALSLVAVIPAGYVLAVYDFPGRKTILVITLIAMITPNTAVALPIFLQMSALGLNNTYLGMILATAFFPFGVYLAYIYFATSLPSGLLDSGRIDGCSQWQLFTRIALPLAGPVTALIAFFSFLANWSNYFLAFVLLSDDKLYNLPVGLAALLSSSGALGNDVANDIPIKKPEAIMAAIMVILPVLLVFMVSQRYVRAGLLSGAEKG